MPATTTQVSPMDFLLKLFHEKKLGVHALVCMFAISSWVNINGLWVELPIFVTHLPEQWTLPSYITVLSQIANIGPLLFILIAYLLAKSSISKLTLDKVASFAIMVVGLTSTFLLAFLWKRTHHVAGSNRSIGLLVLSFFLSMMDCTSSVAYVAFMSALKPVYMSSFFLGEGLSGFLPAMMALGQGAGDIDCVNGSSTEEKNVSGVIVNVTTYFEYPMYRSPHFSVQVFCILLCFMIVSSMTAFFLLNFWRYCKQEFVSATSSPPLDRNINVDSGGISPRSEGQAADEEGIANPVFFMNRSNASENTERDPVDLRKCSPDSQTGSDPPLPARAGDHVSCENSPSTGTGGCGNVITSVSGGMQTKGEYSLPTIMMLLTQVVIINFLITSFLLSVQTYSSLPYGISTYHVVVNLANIANPIACLISMFFAITSPLVITVLTSSGVACGVYIIVAAAMSPEPPMVGHSAGGPIVVLIWVGASFFLTYAKVSVAGTMRQMGRRALLGYGVATQAGALGGALTGFALVNEAKVFKSASWC